MNMAPRAPSSTRWSHESVIVIIGLTATPPMTGTRRSFIAPTARIPACGGTMIAVNESTWYIPRLLIVNVAPVMSDGDSLFVRARSVRSRRRDAMSPRLMPSVFGTTPTTTASVTAIARPTLTSALALMASPVQLAFMRGCLRSACATMAVSRSV